VGDGTVLRRVEVRPRRHRRDLALQVYVAGQLHEESHGLVGDQLTRVVEQDAVKGGLQLARAVAVRHQVAKVAQLHDISVAAELSPRR
jgi:hypothetical protein